MMDVSRLVELLNGPRGDRVRSLVECLFPDALDYVLQCSYCDEWADIEGFTRVYANPYIRTCELVCESCRDDSYMYCETSCRYYSSDDVVCTCDGARVHRDYAYYWESDGGYHTEEEPEPEEGEICSYHSLSRGSTSTTYDVGVELEVDGRGDRAELSKRIAGMQFICEEDRSLMDTGFEIIQRNPCEYTKALEIWEPVLAQLPSQAQLPGYGMHVNICTEGLSGDAVALFVAFWSINCDVVQRVACRSYRHYAKSMAVADKPQVVYDAKSDKYLACAVRSHNRVEVRIFRTTRELWRFEERVELCVALLAWCARHEDANLVEVSNVYRIANWCGDAGYSKAASCLLQALNNGRDDVVYQDDRGGE